MLRPGPAVSRTAAISVLRDNPWRTALFATLVIAVAAMGFLAHRSASLSGQLSDSRSALQSTRSSLSSTTATLKSTQAELTRTRSTVASQQETIGAKNDELDSVNGKLRSATGRITNLKGQVSGLNGQVTSLNTTVANTRSDLADAQGDVAVGKTTVDALYDCATGALEAGGYSLDGEYALAADVYESIQEPCGTGAEGARKLGVR